MMLAAEWTRGFQGGRPVDDGPRAIAPRAAVLDPPGAATAPQPPAEPVAPAPYLVDLLSRRQKRQIRLLGATWIVAQVLFWAWWLRPEHVVTWPGMVVNSALFFWTTFLPAWYLFFVVRMKQPNPALDLPDGRVAMVVTKAPSEPWPVVERVLRAMLAQRFPRPYDVWLADEDPDPQTRAWCAAHGVSISCRMGAIAYHNPTWPARQKCKEGNLRYFYEVMGGYDRYDFVSQCDADQVPDPNYLAEMIRPFNDPAVGYVAAPSICDNNADRSWSARGRLHVEASWHGPVQAGYNDGFAPQCIGSHYAVRTRALREIGGLGPELAEDFSTTLMMNAYGWKGTFALNAIAHGDGPACVADCLTQEFQWSRSIVRILLLHNHRYFARLPLHLKVKFGFCQVWYPLYTLHMLAVFLLPIVAILTNTPWVRVNLLHFYLIALPGTLAGLAVVRFTRANGWLRPPDAPVLSWEATLFQFMRWPWMLAGVVDAVVGVLRGRESTFKVTPKGEARGPMPWRLLVPYLAIVLAETGAVIFGGRANLATGYYLLAIVNAAIYVNVAIALPLLHFMENRPPGAGRVHYARLAVRLSPVIASLIVMLALAVVLRGDEALTALLRNPSTGEATTALVEEVNRAPDSAPPVAAPVPAVEPAPPEPAAPSVAVEPASVEPAFAEVRPASAEAALAVEGASPTVWPFELPANRLSVGAYDPRGLLADVQLDLEHRYVRQDAAHDAAAALASARNQCTLLLTVEPFPAAGQTEPVLDVIAAGGKDQELRALARTIRAASPQVVLVRWGHEMEISGLYPWSANAPEIYRAAYRHVVAIFREEGVDNARWVWSPAGHEEAPAYYPGDDVVDYIGLTALGDAGWDASIGLPEQSFEALFEPRYRRVAGFGKPIIVAELGVSGTPDRQARWLAEAARALERLPSVRCLVYFDARNPPTSREATQPDWRLPPEILRAFVFAVRREPVVIP